VRWGQAPLAPELLVAAEAVFRADLYDRALGPRAPKVDLPEDRVGAFAGPPFDPDRIAAYLSAWSIKWRW
jgi:two-component system, oxyanion-binding sensor